MIGSQLDDRYLIEAEIGRGGMGAVYRAYDSVLERPVAVKVLANAALASPGPAGQGLGRERQERLLQEARAVARLDHPNIVTVYDAGVAGAGAAGADATPYIVMQLVEGRSLAEEKPASMAATVDIIAQVCAALSHAHAQGIVHRDVKPENVLLTAEGVAKLMDFGLARSVEVRLTVDGAISGTLAYIAPEQALGQPVDGRADLYALGVMLYELSTGRLPFEADSAVALITQHLHAPVVPPRARNESLSPALDALILRLLSKKPADRPASAAEVGEALRALEQAERADGGGVAAAAPAELTLLDRIVRGRLAGREVELAEATALWQRAAGGAGQVLLISGEPGIGKSRLVREMTTRVEVSGGLALLGECYAEGGAPYAPFAQIVRRALGDGQSGAGLPQFVLADLLPLAPELRLTYEEVPPNPPLDPEAEQRRFFESMVIFGKALSARRPLLLILDDAHWADSGSLALLRHLARRSRQQPVMIVATYREVELDESLPLNQVLLDLNRERLASRIKLTRLDRATVGRMLATLFDEEITPEFLEGIYRETEGNPFFVEEVCKALIDSGKLTFQDGQWQRPAMAELEIPQSVRVAIQARVATLPEEHQEALRLAAVLGREFDYDALAEASDLSEDRLIDVLEAAERAQLVAEVSEERGGTFAFAHALIPATLTERLSGLRRRRLHRLVVRAIESLRPDDFEALATHSDEAGDEERALKYYTLAGKRAAAAYANQEAERHYRAALNLAAAAEQRAPLLANLGLALVGQSRFAEAIETWQAAIPLFMARPDLDRVAWCYARSARAAWEEGDFRRGLELAEAGIESVMSPDGEAAASADVADLLHEMARASHFNGRPEQARAYCQRALALAEAAGVESIQVEALTTWGILEGVPAGERIASLERAVALAQEYGLPEQEHRARNNLALYIAFQGQVDAAREHYIKAIALTQRTGQIAMELWFWAQVTYYAIFQGDLTTAEQALPRMGTLYEEASRPATAGLLYRHVQVYLLRARGELEKATQGYREVVGDARELGQLQEVWWIGTQLAELLLERGQLEKATSLLREALAIGDRIGSTAVTHLLMAVAAARQGRLDEARQFLGQGETKVAQESYVIERPAVARARALIALAEERWDEAWPHFAAEIEEMRRVGNGSTLGPALIEWAEAHISRGRADDLERARELLAQALAHFETIGAPPYAEKVRARLREIGS